ncbi:MAG: hypothetical protein B7Y48_01400 [Methylophilales bacterium 28-44-11]|nr:MAG: hypothetical protein B7Y48_01400 [Methylophilales bacterium 28-44-11]
MRKSLLLTAVLGTFAMANIAYAEEAPAEAAPAEAAAPAEPASSWTATSNIGFVSDYYTRGISQSWHKPAVQGGFDIAHSSGFFAGVWGSNVSPNTFPDASVELDAYAGYNGSISAVEGLGYSVGVIGYFYPGGSWKKYNYLGTPDQTPEGGRWDTYEANVGISYKWLSAKASVTLGDWFGAERKTGWDGGTSGSTYIELNAAYPLPVWGLTLIGHVGRLNVAGELDVNYVSSSGQLPSATTESTSPDYTDWKIGLSKSFKIANAEGFNAGLYWVDSSNNSYWSDKGYGGSSFNASSETKNLNDGRFVVTVGRTF